MALTLYFHPLSSFCQKVLIALYENGVAFQPHVLDLSKPEVRTAFNALWPTGKMPVLRDESRGETVPESTTIIEYLDQHYPGAQTLLSSDPEVQLEIRLWDRIFDTYVHVPMQKAVTDGFRPKGANDPHGVAEAEKTIRMAYGLIDQRMSSREWAAGDSFSMADCAATPALFYASVAVPFGQEQNHLAAYFERLISRPSVQRTIDEAKPYFPMFPLYQKMQARFR